MMLMRLSETVWAYPWDIVALGVDPEIGSDGIETDCWMVGALMNNKARAIISIHPTKKDACEELDRVAQRINIFVAENSVTNEAEEEEEDEDNDESWRGN